MTSTAGSAGQAAARWGLAAVAGLGIVVAAVLAAYSRVSPGDGAAIITFGFPTLLAMKSWLTTAAMVFLVVQVVSALAMWGRLPGSRIPRLGRSAPPVVGRRGVRAHPAGRVPVHLVAGLLRRLGPHVDPLDRRVPVLRGVRGQDAVPAAARLPGWTLPVLGGLLTAF